MIKRKSNKLLVLFYNSKNSATRRARFSDDIAIDPSATVYFTMLIIQLKNTGFAIVFR